MTVRAHFVVHSRVMTENNPDEKDPDLQAAVDREIISIVADALANRHPVARQAPEHLKAQAAASIL